MSDWLYVIEDVYLSCCRDASFFPINNPWPTEFCCTCTSFSVSPRYSSCSLNSPSPSLPLSISTPMKINLIRCSCSDSLEFRVTNIQPSLSSRGQDHIPGMLLSWPNCPLWHWHQKRLMWQMQAFSLSVQSSRIWGSKGSKKCPAASASCAHQQYPRAGHDVLIKRSSSVMSGVRRRLMLSQLNWVARKHLKDCALPRAISFYRLFKDGFGKPVSGLWARG